MHFSFGLLRIKGLYMFRALLDHPREALYVQQLVYCVRVDIYDMIIHLIAIGLTPGGSSTVHIHTQTVHRTKQWKRIQNTEQFVSASILVQPVDITRTQYTKCRLYSVSWGWASNGRPMLYAHAAIWRGLGHSLSERHFRGMAQARARHGKCESNTAALCKPNGKDTI
jgi:hypothetical protein